MNALFQTFMQVARYEIANAPGGLLVADLTSRSRRELGSSKIAHNAVNRLEALGEIELRAAGRDIVAFPSRPLRELVYELVASHKGPMAMPDIRSALPHRTSLAVSGAVYSLAKRYDMRITHGLPVTLELIR
ncbi:hypothetical protein ACUN9V_05670 [Salinicola sp. V024]|uniref:hypothetical protein n=1 Tax=Salinicola sp. V024 TaxID=3459609 RepID=UPI00404503F2